MRVVQCYEKYRILSLKVQCQGFSLVYILLYLSFITQITLQLQNTQVKLWLILVLLLILYQKFLYGSGLWEVMWIFQQCKLSLKLLLCPLRKIIFAAYNRQLNNLSQFLQQEQYFYAFYYLALQQNEALMMSICIQLYFSGQRGKPRCDGCALPAHKKKGNKKGKICQLYPAHLSLICVLGNKPYVLHIVKLLVVGYVVEQCPQDFCMQRLKNA